MIKTTEEIVNEENKCIHNCSMTDDLKRINKQWADIEDLIKIIKWRIIELTDELLLYPPPNKLERITGGLEELKKLLELLKREEENG